MRDPRVRTRYSAAQAVLAILYPVVLGLTRLEAAYSLRSNGIFQYLTGRPQFPNPSTLRRFLAHAPTAWARQLGALTDGLTRRLLQQPHPRSRVVFNLDSTNLLVYGTQERTTRAHNARGRGVPSYEPLLCHEANSGLCWAGHLRPGGNPGADEVVPFLEHCRAILPASVREVRVRGDAGFYSARTLAWLDQHHYQYAIVARLTAPLKRLVTGLRYRPLSHHRAVAETWYHGYEWSEPRRIVAVRHALVGADPEPALFTLGRYGYHAYVTNLALSPEAVWRFYNDRACLELLIRELKGNYGLGHIPTRCFDANAFYFQILRLAYNLVVGCQTLCLPDPWRYATLSTIRQQLLLLPAVLAKPQGRPVLRFSAASPARADVPAILKRLRALRQTRIWSTV